MYMGRPQRRFQLGGRCRELAELAIIISYPRSASEIIVLLKTPQHCRKLD